MGPSAHGSSHAASPPHAGLRDLQVHLLSGRVPHFRRAGRARVGARRHGGPALRQPAGRRALVGVPRVHGAQGARRASERCASEAADSMAAARRRAGARLVPAPLLHRPHGHRRRAAPRRHHQAAAHAHLPRCGPPDRWDAPHARDLPPMAEKAQHARAPPSQRPPSSSSVSAGGSPPRSARSTCSLTWPPRSAAPSWSSRGQGSSGASCATTAPSPRREMQGLPSPPPTRRAPRRMATRATLSSAARSSRSGCF